MKNQYFCNFNSDCQNFCSSANTYRVMQKDLPDSGQEMNTALFRRAGSWMILCLRTADNRIPHVVPHSGELNSMLSLCSCYARVAGWVPWPWPTPTRRSNSWPCRRCITSVVCSTRVAGWVPWPGPTPTRISYSWPPTTHSSQTNTSSTGGTYSFPLNPFSTTQNM